VPAASVASAADRLEEAIAVCQAYADQARARFETVSEFGVGELVNDVCAAVLVSASRAGVALFRHGHDPGVSLKCQCSLIFRVLCNMALNVIRGDQHPAVRLPQFR